MLEWHKLMMDCNSTLYSDSASDLNLLSNWDIYKASSELKQAWDQRLIRSGMRIAGKGHTTRSVFATDARLDGHEFFEETTDEATEETTHGLPSSRKRVAFDG